MCQGSALAAGLLGLSLCRPCNAPATGEVETMPCGHTFHKECLLEHQEVTGQEGCPQKCGRATTVDGADASMSAILSADKDNADPVPASASAIERLPDDDPEICAGLEKLLTLEAAPSIAAEAEAAHGDAIMSSA